MIYLDTLIYNLHGPLKEYTSCTRPIYVGDFPSSVTMCADLLQLHHPHFDHSFKWVKQCQCLHRYGQLRVYTGN